MNATIRRGAESPEYLRAKLLSRLLEKVQIAKYSNIPSYLPLGYSTGCWLWTGVLSYNGYGHFWSGGKYMQAHRFSYEFFVGPIEPGKCILHRRECGNRNCVNPNHLYMGTQNDNMRDMMLWGKRNSYRGERHPSAKLSKDDVLDIRKKAKEGMLRKDIAAIYGIHISHVGNIIRRVHWKHLKEAQ